MFETSGLLQVTECFALDDATELFQDQVLHDIEHDIDPDDVARMVAQIEKSGGRVDTVMYCPHRPDEECGCRKPRPGMLLEAAQQRGLDLSGSYMIGDACSDMIAGHAAGCKSFRPYCFFL